MANIKPLGEELQRIAYEDLGEIPSKIPEDLQALKKWLTAQPHLKVRTDDQFLIQFLRGSKYSLEKAKHKLDLYYLLKTKYPEMFNATDVDEAKFRGVTQLGCFAAMPQQPNGIRPRIIVFQFKKFAATEYTLADVFRPFAALHEYLMYNDPCACIQGIVYIVDYAGATASQYLQMTPTFAKKLVSFAERSLPLRIKDIYYVNTAAAAQQFIKILLPFLTEKIRRRVHVMGDNLDTLHKGIPAEYLPADYGGTQPSLIELIKENQKIWDENREFFKQNAEYGVNEKLRSGKAIDLDGLFGVDGTFRNLNVD